MSCARTRTSVGPPRWTWRSTCSTACWSWDARPTSASPDPKRGWGQCAHSPDPCNTVADVQSRCQTTGWWAWMAAPVWAVLINAMGPTQGADLMDIPALFATAQQEGRVGLARKSKLVDARPATAGEVVITTIAGEGKETQSKPAEPGDMVVRNRCEGTGNEEYLVKAAVPPAVCETPDCMLRGHDRG